MAHHQIVPYNREQLNENSKLFGKEAILAYQQNRKPDYNLERLRRKFLNSDTGASVVIDIKPVSSTIPYVPYSTQYIPDYAMNSNVNQPLLKSKCLCVIL